MKILKILIPFFLIVIMISCESSDKNKIVGTWIMKNIQNNNNSNLKDEYTENINHVIDYGEILVIFERNGAYISKMSVEGSNYIVTTKGKWEYNKIENSIIIHRTYSAGGEYGDLVYKISDISKNEMNILTNIDGTSYKIRLFKPF